MRWLVLLPGGASPSCRFVRTFLRSTDLADPVLWTELVASDSVTSSPGNRSTHSVTKFCYDNVNSKSYFAVYLLEYLK